MAVMNIRTDDINESTEGVETFSFAVAGKSYEIDLGPENAERFEADFDKWIAHSREVKSTRIKRASKPAAERDYDPAEVREWATENGFKVAPKGRIHLDVLNAWRNRDNAAAA